MYTCNITFVASPDKEPELLAFLRQELIPRIFNDKAPALSPELRKVVEVGGEKPDAEHGVSIALAATFPNEDEYRFWNEDVLLPALQDFHKKFGNNALYFITLLENLPL